MVGYIKFVLLGILCFCLIMPTFAQSNENVPEAVALSYFAALQSEDWVKCASLVHPKSLNKIRKDADKFVDSLLVVDKYGGNLRSYFDVASKEEYEELSDSIVFQHVIQRISQQPGYSEILKATKYKVIGSLKETDNLVHVLYRSDVELFDSDGNRLKIAKFEKGNDLIRVVAEVKLREPDADRAELISVRKDGEAWKILPGDEIQQALKDWEKMIQEFQDNMRKYVEAALAQEAKTKQKPKSKRKSLNR
jgi:hypothetical protein